MLQTPSPSPTPSSAEQGREEAACEVKQGNHPLLSPLGEKKVDSLSIKIDLSSQNDNKNCNATFCPPQLIFLPASLCPWLSCSGIHHHHWGNCPEGKIPQTVQFWREGETYSSCCLGQCGEESEIKPVLSPAQLSASNHPSKSALLAFSFKRNVVMTVQFYLTSSVLQQIQRHYKLTGSIVQ